MFDNCTQYFIRGDYNYYFLKGFVINCFIRSNVSLNAYKSYFFLLLYVEAFVNKINVIKHFQESFLHIHNRLIYNIWWFHHIFSVFFNTTNQFKFVSYMYIPIYFIHEAKQMLGCKWGLQNYNTNWNCQYFNILSHSCW